MPTEQRASERLRGRGGLATWHRQFNLGDGAVCWCQANREVHSESLGAETETAENPINAALRVFHYQYLSQIRFTFKVPVL